MSGDLYQEAIVELARKARALPRLNTADRTATIDNPLCGDRVTLDLNLEAGKIIDVGHKIRGCLLCEAAAFLIAEHAIGEAASVLKKKADQVTLFIGDECISFSDLWPGLEVLAPVRLFKSRHECVTLPFQALIKALDETG